MPFDFKKEYKEFYLPPAKPVIVIAPKANYIAVRGKGDPNDEGVDYSDKSTFCWISVIRLPDFITEADFDWAVQIASKKKKKDCSCAEFLTIDEGLCVQIMHIGPYDNEPASVAFMDKFLAENGYENDMTASRLHHEIYLSDARKVAPENWKTVIRHPIKKM